MFGSEILEALIALSLIYLLLSLISTSVREAIETVMKSRAVDLEKGIRELLHDRDGKDLTKAVYSHPLIYSLFDGDYEPGKIRKGAMPFRSNLPSYIPARNFAMALMDIAARGQQSTLPAEATRITLEQLRASVTSLGNVPVARALLSAIDTAQGDLTRAQQNIEAWFDSAMDRVSGWYKRRSQYIIFAIGLALTVGVNVNTLTVIQRLMVDDSLRAVVVETAVAAAEGGDTEAPVQSGQETYDRLAQLGLPIGWDQGWPGPRVVPFAEETDDKKCSGFEECLGWGGRNILYPLLGWLITAFAISLGAPFWFDLLNKFVSIRSSTKPVATPPAAPPAVATESSVASAPSQPPVPETAPTTDSRR